MRSPRPHGAARGSLLQFCGNAWPPRDRTAVRTRDSCLCGALPSRGTPWREWPGGPAGKKQPTPPTSCHSSCRLSCRSAVREAGGRSARDPVPARVRQDSGVWCLQEEEAHLGGKAHWGCFHGLLRRALGQLVWASADSAGPAARLRPRTAISPSGGHSTLRRRFGSGGQRKEFPSTASVR